MGMMGFALHAEAQMPPLEVPFVSDWGGSAHARYNEEPFIHWNLEGEVPAACARCHTTNGFRDYIGDDGSPAGSVEKGQPTGQVVSCVACHNHTTLKMTEVTFPSGVTIKGLGRDAVCIACHQGRESMVSVNKATDGLPDDVVSDKLKFINIHYRAAGATRYGTEAKGGFEYKGKTYAGLFLHDKEATVCSDCHTLHTFRVDVENCNLCHRDVKAKADFQKIVRSEGDFNGNGDAKEGMGMEISGMHEKLLAAIQAYATKVAKAPIIYDPMTYPYYFNDKNANGMVDGGEAIFPNQFKSWTPNLLRAAYNYQVVAKDPGAYTHNPKYVLQLMYDSIESLAGKTKIDMDKMKRP
jgi:hypothetical protein